MPCIQPFSSSSIWSYCHRTIIKPCHIITVVTRSFSPRNLVFSPKWRRVNFMVGTATLKMVLITVSSNFPRYSSFHHCSILAYHRPLLCVIALTRQHIITLSVKSCTLFSQLTFSELNSCFRSTSQILSLNQTQFMPTSWYQNHLTQSAKAQSFWV